MKLELNVTKKHFWIILTAIAVLAIGIFAYAYTQSIPNPGHGGNNILVDYNGEKDLQTALTEIKNSIGSGSGSSSGSIYVPTGNFEIGKKTPRCACDTNDQVQECTSTETTDAAGTSCYDQYRVTSPIYSDRSQKWVVVQKGETYCDWTGSRPIRTSTATGCGEPYDYELSAFCSNNKIVSIYTSGQREAGSCPG